MCDNKKHLNQLHDVFNKFGILYHTDMNNYWPAKCNNYDDLYTIRLWVAKSLSSEFFNQAFYSVYAASSSLSLDKRINLTAGLRYLYKQDPYNQRADKIEKLYKRVQKILNNSKQSIDEYLFLELVIDSMVKSGGRINEFLVVYDIRRRQFS